MPAYPELPEEKVDKDTFEALLVPLKNNWFYNCMETIGIYLEGENASDINCEDIMRK